MGNFQRRYDLEIKKIWLQPLRAKRMPAPGIEPGSVRPQRTVLATILGRLPLIFQVELLYNVYIIAALVEPLESVVICSFTINNRHYQHLLKRLYIVALRVLL